MTTFWAYQTGHGFGSQKGADHVYEEFKELFKTIHGNRK